LHKRFSDSADVLAERHRQPSRQDTRSNRLLVGLRLVANGFQSTVERKQSAHVTLASAGD